MRRGIPLDLDAYVKKIVAEAPPLTEAQKCRIAALLRPEIKEPTAKGSAKEVSAVDRAHPRRLRNRRGSSPA
jgi:hypothetical protein